VALRLGCDVDEFGTLRFEFDADDFVSNDEGDIERVVRVVGEGFPLLELAFMIGALCDDRMDLPRDLGKLPLRLGVLAPLLALR